MNPNRPAGSAHTTVWYSKVFLSVLALKLLASFFFASPYMTELFVPFLNQFVLSGFQNPWDFFYAKGMTNMFPYPPVMLWIMTAPRLAFSPLLPAAWESVVPLHLFSARIPLVIFDVILFAQILKLFPTQTKRVLIIYWCSPIIFFINYLHGQLDIVPTALFFISASLLIRERLLASALVLALSAAAKTHIFIALPFLAVFLYKKKIGIRRLAAYFSAFSLLYLLFTAPYAGSEAFRQMVFNSPEQRRLFEFTIPVSDSLRLIVCPTVVALLFIKFASYKKLNREILFMFLGIVFAALVVFVPPMPGWFLWSLPFLIYFYLSSTEYSRAPFVLYNVIYVLYFLFFFEKEPAFLGPLAERLPVKDLALSVMLATVGFIGLWMFHLGVRKNEELKIAETPLLIGIGGDSGSGKHTLLRVLRNLVGKPRSIPIFGDDFHKWERGNENWQVYTHLDPSANRLHGSMDAAVALRDGRTIKLGHYDHKSGRFTDPETLQPSKFIFFVGLHPFYLKKMRGLIGIKIFLDTDPALKNYWKLRRDVTKRGHSPEKVKEQISARQEDQRKYIEPQKEFADLIIRYEPVMPIDAASQREAEIPIKTTFTMDNSIHLEPLLEELSRIGTLRAEHFTDVSRQQLEVSGTITAREVMNAAFRLAFNLDELFINTRGWLRDHYGLAQLVFLTLYNHQRSH